MLPDKPHTFTHAHTQIYTHTVEMNPPDVY